MGTPLYIHHMSYVHTNQFFFGGEGEKIKIFLGLPIFNLKRDLTPLLTDFQVFFKKNFVVRGKKFNKWGGGHKFMLFFEGLE